MYNFLQPLTHNLLLFLPRNGPTLPVPWKSWEAFMHKQGLTILKWFFWLGNQVYPPTRDICLIYSFNKYLMSILNVPVIMSVSGSITRTGTQPLPSRTLQSNREDWHLTQDGNPLQYSCLENSMDRGAWRTTVHGVAKSWARQSD